ncbi:hypothetical protein D5018_15245 [Parashewanella curva]|uniref:Topo IA-type catalytic domain-containing protein n=1 Tax=Parashewanella curva TaxID=2338552 RepID=A0A3L8PU63_9GAMM|nr:hypothetical protein D5018_15245 [Parashewanella curva]
MSNLDPFALACQPYMDEEGRVLAKGLAENVVSRIGDQAAEITKLETKDKKQNPPLTYNLSSLQIDCAKRFAMSAQDVLSICQSLYEKHKLITYPRSDSRYLPKEQLQLASSVVAAVVANASELVSNIPQPNTNLKSKVWNDSKVDAHHAIVPTEKRVDLTKLSANESKVYQQVARQYLAQFYPAYLYQETQVEVTIAGGKFSCKSKTEQSLGWKSLFKSSTKENSPDRTETQLLPPLTLGQKLTCTHGELLEKQTQPPKHFTDATLLSAMTGINRFVQDPEIKKVLKETDGLGTEATRAGIIELLFKRGFMKRQGKTILATEAGIGLIKSLPDNVSQPDMTALWESSLEAISRKETRYQDFMLPMQHQLHQLIEIACQQLPTALQGVKSTQSKKRFYRKKSTFRKGKTSSKKSI